MNPTECRTLSPNRFQSAALSLLGGLAVLIQVASRTAAAAERVATTAAAAEQPRASDRIERAIVATEGKPPMARISARVRRELKRRF